MGIPLMVICFDPSVSAMVPILPLSVTGVAV